MMNFEEKLINQLNDFSVSVPNQPKHLKHHYADYVELISLFSNENSFTYIDLIDRLQDEGTILYEERDTITDDEIGSYAAEVDDQEETWAKSVFEILYHRHLLFLEDYPFAISNNRIELVPPNEITVKQKIYLTLLVASSLNIFGKIQQDLTSEFETISYYALKHFLPPYAKVKQFGKNSDYTGTAISKIRSLAQDMNIEVDEKKIANISTKNTQEKGLDLVGWLPFGDGLPNMIAVLVQCTCTKKWYGKQHETRRYENYLKFYNQKPIHALFIPYGITSLDNCFYQDDEFSDALMFSRKRILEFNTQSDYFRDLNSHTAINQFIEYEEDIV